MKETLRFAVTPEEAGVLIAAHASEELDGPEASAAADARLIAGKDPKDRALAKAKLVLSRRSLKPSRMPALPTGLFTGALVFAAFLLGVLTDRFTSEGAVVNLLSPTPRGLISQMTSSAQLRRPRRVARIPWRRSNGMFGMFTLRSTGPASRSASRKRSTTVEATLAALSSSAHPLSICEKAIEGTPKR